LAGQVAAQAIPPGVESDPLKWLQQMKHKRWLVSMLHVLSLLWQGPFVFGMIQHPIAIEADARKDAKEADTQVRVFMPEPLPVGDAKYSQAGTRCCPAGARCH
jgi:hypothetical protein